jgi:hypothetical protein
VNLRLLDLDDRTARVGELVIFLVERVGDREHALRHALVMTILQGEGDDLGGNGAELDRPRGEALRRLPHRGVLQIAASDRPGDHRHHPRFKIIVQDMTARKPNAAAAGRRRHRMLRIEPAHMVRRIRRPALAADVVVEAAVAIGKDIQPRKFLIAQIARQCVFVLLAKTAAHHRLEKMARAEILHVPAWPRQRSGDGRRQSDIFGGPVHARLPRRFRGIRGCVVSRSCCSL